MATIEKGCCRDEMVESTLRQRFNAERDSSNDFISASMACCKCSQEFAWVGFIIMEDSRSSAHSRCSSSTALAPDLIVSGATKRVRTDALLWQFQRNKLISNINTCPAIAIALQVTCRDPPMLWATSCSYMGGAPSLSCGGISRPPGSKSRSAHLSMSRSP